MSTLKVNTILSETPNVTIADGLNVTGVSTVTTLNTTNIINATQLSHRNLIINGAMQVAQRGTSSTSSGINSVDRFGVWYDNVDEAPTQEQYVMNSGDTEPWESGFRNALKVTNGNQTSGAGADDYIWIQTNLEAQDIANSGWNYTSSSSYVTLSFWIKTSVSQSYKCYLRTRDGTERQYPFETGTVSANTWTKIVKTIPGNSGLQFDNDANQGLQINIGCFFGTNLTASGVTENAWGSWSSSARVPDMTSTWYTTNDAVFRITGVQLEVGSVATPFEHRSMGHELELCKRYYQVLVDDGNAKSFGNATGYNSTSLHFVTPLRPEMRATPTLDYTTGTDYYGAYQNNTVDYFDTFALVGNSHTRNVDLMAASGVSITAASSVLLRTTNASSKIRFTAEL